LDPSVSDINVHDTTKYVMKNCAVEVDESKVEHEFIALKERESDKLVFIQGSLKRENPVKFFLHKKNSYLLKNAKN
jgi:hypothetical protein